MATWARPRAAHPPLPDPSAAPRCLAPQHAFSGGAAITVPVTIGWGRKDRLLPPRQARRAQREIPSARIVMLDDCGHIPTYDDPALVTQVLLEGSSRR